MEIIFGIILFIGFSPILMLKGIANKDEELIGVAGVGLILLVIVAICGGCS